MEEMNEQVQQNAMEEPGQQTGETAVRENAMEQADGQNAEMQQEQAETFKNDVNAQNAQRRREQEARSRERMFRKVTEGMVDPRTGQPFADEAAWNQWKQDASLAAQAKKAGVDTEQARQLLDGMRESLRETDPEYIRMREENENVRRQQAERTFAEDLLAIKKLYPDEKAANVAELGEQFMRIMASGQVDAVAAYEAVRAQARRNNPKPPSTGAIGGSRAGNGGTFTKEQAKAMSFEEADKHYEEIRKSMANW